MFSRRDVDDFDRLCDHLLVLDHGASTVGAARTKPKVVGTYRLLRQDIAERNQGFYTAGEYDIAPMLAAHPHLRFLELGRSCVLKPYRNKRTVELLWAGIWAYVLHHRIDVMIGCASLEGTDPRAFSLPLSFLHHFARASGDWQASAWPQHGTSMNHLPKEAIDQKAALRALPPLIKGYLRLGAYIRKRRRHRPPLRHHGCAGDPAGGTDQSALYRAFRRGCRPSRGAGELPAGVKRRQSLAIGRIAEPDAELLHYTPVRDALVFGVEALGHRTEFSLFRTGYKAVLGCRRAERRMRGCPAVGRRFRHIISRPGKRA